MIQKFKDYMFAIGMALAVILVITVLVLCTSWPVYDLCSEEASTFIANNKRGLVVKEIETFNFTPKTYIRLQNVVTGEQCKIRIHGKCEFIPLEDGQFEIRSIK